MFSNTLPKINGLTNREWKDTAKKAIEKEIIGEERSPMIVWHTKDFYEDNYGSPPEDCKYYACVKVISLETTQIIRAKYGTLVHCFFSSYVCSNKGYKKFFSTLYLCKIRKPNKMPTYVLVSCEAYNRMKQHNAQHAHFFQPKHQGYSPRRA